MQRCAKEILGETHVHFESGIHTDPVAYEACREAGIFDKGYKYYWKHENGFNQWFIDGLTIEATRMLSGKTVLWDSSCGKGAPVHESDVVNASPGDLPQVYAFLASHAEFGTVLFLPRLSCKGGDDDAWDGVEFYTAHISEEEKELVKDMQMYLQPGTTTHKEHDKAAVDAHRAAVLAERLGNINPKLFLVRPVHSMCCCT